MGQSKAKGKGKTGKGKGAKSKPKNSPANKQAREATADLIDERLAKALAHPMRVQILTVAESARGQPE